MYQTSTETAEAILSYSRTWRIRLEEVGGDIVIMGDEITNAESEHSATTSSDDIEVGAVCAAGWTITTSRQGEYVGKRFKLYLYLLDLGESTTLGDLYPYTISDLSVMTIDELYHMGHMIGEPIPMGVYTCVKAPRCGDGRELHLYDKLYFTDKPYVKGIPTPALASDIEQDICNQLGIENATAGTDGGFLEVNASQYYRQRGLLVGEGGHYLFFPPVDFTISSRQFPKDVTMRQVLGYIAMIHGQFGCIDRAGRYTRRWFSVSSMATIDSDHADEPTVSEAENQIVGIRCKVDDETELTAGLMSGGRILELENPFMTDTLIRALFVKVKKMSWYTAQVTERLGDPRHDIGDTVTIESNGSNYDIPITMIQYSFDGGLLANISAAGLTEEEQTTI
jgi:hypothetical protein